MRAWRYVRAALGQKRPARVTMYVILRTRVLVLSAELARQRLGGNETRELWGTGGRGTGTIKSGAWTWELRLSTSPGDPTPWDTSYLGKSDRAGTSTRSAHETPHVPSPRKNVPHKSWTRWQAGCPVRQYPGIRAPFALVPIGEKYLDTQELVE